MQELFQTRDIFTPGGMPQYTYIPRISKKLEDRLLNISHRPYKLITLTGNTKSGKTVLARKIFPKDKSIWVDGGSIKNDEDFWSIILTQLDGYTEKSNESSTNGLTSIGGQIEGQVGIPLFTGIKVDGKMDFERGNTNSLRQTRSISQRIAALQELSAKHIPLVIDDFHYLKKEFQADIVRAMKPLIFDGLTVVFIAIPHRKYDTEKVEKEMTGRIEQIEVPSWDPDELIQIPTRGFPCLNVDIHISVSDAMQKNAYGSPHLMQEFCSHLALSNNIQQTSQSRINIISLDDNLFKRVAHFTGKVIFDKLAKGPRQRKDRKLHRLKIDGHRHVDIYYLVLLALSQLQPKLETLEYEPLRYKIKELVKDQAPRINEITRVLEKLSEIASSNDASSPVLNWDRDERKLHIIDPYFAFYLRWGLELK